MTVSQRDTVHLFDRIARVSKRLPQRREGEYGYLNESARADAAGVRLTYREWFSRYPPEHRDTFASRFRDENLHAAAAFELVLHEAMVRLGLDVRLPPESPGADLHDFDIEHEGCGAAVEVSVVGDNAEDDAGARRRDEVLDFLDHVRHPRFAIHVWDLRTSPKAHPPLAALRSEALRLLDAAGAVEYAQWAGMVAAETYAHLPRWRFERDGFAISFSPVPIPAGVRFRGHVTQLDVTEPMKLVTIGEALRQRARKKRSKKYQLDGRPLLLVLGVTHWAGSDDFEVFRALFGNEHFPVHLEDGKPVGGTPYRDRMGVWGPRYGVPGHVAGVLVARRFRVWDPWTTTWRLYANPLTGFDELPGPIRALERWEPIGPGELKYAAGTDLRTAIGRPGWLEETPDHEFAPRRRQGRPWPRATLPEDRWP